MGFGTSIKNSFQESTEMAWTKLKTTTLTEDVNKFTYTISGNCYGVIVSIKIPKENIFGQGYVKVKDVNETWISALYSNSLSATNNDKELRLVVYPQNGYYQSYGVIKNGSNNTTWTRYEPSSSYFMNSKASKLLRTIEVSPTSSTDTTTITIPSGSTITIWGLIK